MISGRTAGTNTTRAIETAFSRPLTKCVTVRVR